MDMQFSRKIAGIIVLFIIFFTLVLPGIIMSCFRVKYDDPKVTVTRAEGDAREGYINTENGRIWFKIAGADGRKTPLLLLHGGPGACHDYFEPIAALSDERPVIFYDQLGCGNSDKPDDVSLWTVDNYVNEVAEVRRALGLDEVHILGQSWGGGLAAAYYLHDKPDGVRSPILSSPLLDSERWIADQKVYLSMMPEDIQEDVRIAEETGIYDSKEYLDAMDAYYAIHLCRLDPWPPVLIKTFEKISIPVYMHMWGPSEFTCTGTLRSFSLTGDLEKITVPVLFICGEYDEAAPSSMEYYQSLVDNSELLIIKDASHENHLEKEKEYIAALRNFLESAGESSGISSRNI